METQDEWSKWTGGMERVRAATRMTPTSVAMLAAVLLSVASEIGRARLPAVEANALAQQVRERVMGLDG